MSDQSRSSSVIKLNVQEPLQALVAEYIKALPERQVAIDGQWLQLAGLPACRPPRQGWKLHVSATPTSAPHVLQRVLPILLAAGVEFKLSKSIASLAVLNEGLPGQRSQVGKFITVYPVNDQQAVDLAQQLHQATIGLAGPAIPSDQALVPRSLVHYRYGGFAPHMSVSPVGVVIPLLQTPDGTTVPDKRDPWFSKPAWVTDPFEAAGLTQRSKPQSGMLGTRYRIRKALRQTAKGGVYLADDRSLDPPCLVVIKEGRRFACTDSYDRDARERIQHEYAMLTKLSTSGFVPQVYQHFIQEDNHFLVLEYIEGTSLRAWLTQRSLIGEALSLSEIEQIAQTLWSMLSVAHEQHIILHDFNPNNIMVCPDGKLRLIDLEISHCLQDEAPAFYGWTRGFARDASRNSKHQLSFADDYFSFGATLFFLLTLTNPLIAADQQPTMDRFRQLLHRLRPDAPPHLRELTLALLATNDLQAKPVASAQITSYFNGDYTAAETGSVFPLPDAQAIAHNLGAWILQTAQPDNPQSYWPHGGGGYTMLPISIQYGATGTGLFLLDLYQATGQERFLLEAEAALAWSLTWIERNPHLATIPGLYFGCGGVAWLAIAVAKQRGLTSAPTELLSLLERLDQMECPHADLAHGLAGLGWIYVAAAQAFPQAEWVERVHTIAKQLVEHAVPLHGGIGWELVMGQAPDIHYGYSHGNAGIGSFLIAAAELTNDPLFDAPIHHVAQALIDAQLTVAHGAGISWPHSVQNQLVWPHFCNGAGGVSLFWSRLYAWSGEQRYADLAEQAAMSAWLGCRGAPAGICHGIAGAGLALIEVAKATGKPIWRERAADLAQLLLLRGHNADGVYLWESDGSGAFNADLMVGNAGVGAFFLRLNPTIDLAHPVALPLTNAVAEERIG